jgi:hypothetical protein
MTIQQMATRVKRWRGGTAPGPAQLSPGPIHPAVGAGWIWSSPAAAWGDATRDDRVLRIDPRTLGGVQVLHLGGNVPSVTFGLGSVWAAVSTGAVVRIR